MNQLAGGADQRPNWNKWRHMPEVKVWEAVALSLDIDPFEVGSRRGASWHDPWAYVLAAFDKGRGFLERLEVTIANIGHTLDYVPPRREDRAYETVKLRQFAAWCLSVVEWPIPEELRALAEPSSSGQAPTIASKPPTNDVVLGKRERETLLTLIAVLAQKQRLDLGKPYEAAKILEGMTIEARARISQNAIANHLQAALKALKDRQSD